MKDYVTIGPVPGDESCAQVGQDDFEEQSRKECRAFKAQLLRQFGEPPEGAEVRVKAFPHDFGTYREVVVEFGDTPEAGEYAFKVEAEALTEWDDTARRELGL